MLEHLSERGGGAEAWSAQREVLRKCSDLRLGNPRDDEDDATAGLARHREAATSGAH